MSSSDDPIMPLNRTEGSVSLAQLVTLRAERDEARAKLNKVRQELAATLECYCGTCFACRVADVLGAA